ncbi:MAG: winged helix-turn-helix transcriptional regulator [Actinomycetota bacterium]|nr:winged helix-turn-helix transcriptional regulator [Actinomycetota bacterium]
MITKRTYGEACGLAHAGELVGERWALLVIRELLLGPKRFTDLRAGIPRVSPNVLGQRLRELEQAGIVRRRTLPPPAGSRVYELTEWGHELEPIALGLGAWAARSPSFPYEAEIGVDSLVLALKALFDPGAAGDLEVNSALLLDGQSFHVNVSGGAIEVGRDGPADPEVTVETDTATLNSVIMADRDLDDAIDSGKLVLDGSRDAFEALLGVLALPDPAPAAEPASVA